MAHVAAWLLLIWPVIAALLWSAGLSGQLLVRNLAKLQNYHTPGVRWVPGGDTPPGDQTVTNPSQAG